LLEAEAQSGLVKKQKNLENPPRGRGRSRKPLCQWEREKNHKGGEVVGLRGKKKIGFTHLLKTTKKEKTPPPQRKAGFFPPHYAPRS